MRIPKAQRVSLLDLAIDDPLEGQVSLPPPPVEVNREEEYQVRSVEDGRMNRNQLQYHIRWTGYDSLTWVPATFVDGLQAVEEFHQLFPGKRGLLGNALEEPGA
jgi:predicted GH43/DUF377 family glycosyl hydrolase